MNPFKPKCKNCKESKPKKISTEYFGKAWMCENCGEIIKYI